MRRLIFPLSPSLLFVLLAAWPLAAAAPQPRPYTGPAAPPPPLAVAGYSNLATRGQDNEAFRWRCEQMGCAVRTCTSGQMLLAQLTQATRQFGQVPGLVLFAHGGTHGLFFHHDAGLYPDSVRRRPALRARFGGAPGAAYLPQLVQRQRAGLIRWADAAPILLMSCNARTMAQHLARVCQRPVVGGLGQVEPVNTADSTESGAFTARGGFFRYRPAGQDKIQCEALGDTLRPRRYLWLRRKAQVL